MRADALLEVRRGLHERLLRRVDARGLEEVSRTERRLRVREEALSILREERHILPRGVLTKVINEVSDAVVGLGPIEFLLKDPEVTEVMFANRPTKTLWSGQRSPLTRSDNGSSGPPMIYVTCSCRPWPFRIGGARRGGRRGSSLRWW
jgi:hypothetical protein